jgi:hypothetical protein
MDGVNAAEPGFEDAIKEVEAVVAEFDERTKDEHQSQREKNLALYAALGRAFVFHNTWGDQPQYAELLQRKGVKASARGKKASRFLPTMKAFFDPDLDGFSPAGEVEKADKNRRQKALSTYSATLELAAAKRPNDVAAFIDEVRGVEEARKLWGQLQSDTDEAKKAEAEAKKARQENFDAGLASLKGKMTAVLPRNEALKGNAVLAAIYFDDAGVAHFLGMPAVDDGKALLEKFVIANAPEKAKSKRGRKPGTLNSNSSKTALDRLLKLLNASKLTQPKVMIKITNEEDGCELRVSQNSRNTCMLNARLARQEYLPLGTYWFGTRVIGFMKKFALLGKFGAKFTIDGPSELDSVRATVAITATNYEEAVTSYNEAKSIKWSERDLVPGAMSFITRGDDSLTVRFETVIDKMARVEVDEAKWATVPFEGKFADWYAATLGVAKDKADGRLRKAIHGEATLMKITAHEWALLDEQGTIEPVYNFSSPIGDGKLATEIKVAAGEIQAAIKSVKELSPGGDVTLSMVNKLIRISAATDRNAVEIFIPSLTNSKRHAEYTVFDPAYVGSD